MFFQQFDFFRYNMPLLGKDDFKLMCIDNVEIKVISDDGTCVVTMYVTSSEEDAITVIDYHEGMWPPSCHGTKCLSIEDVDKKFIIKMKHFNI